MKIEFRKSTKRVRDLVIIFNVLVIFQQGNTQSANTLTIENCYEQAIKNYPLIRQKEIFDQVNDFSLDNAGKGFLPQVSVNSQVSYQSDVTQIPISLPDVNIPTPSKDQYKAYVEIMQPLTERNLINQQRKLLSANNAIQHQQLEVDLYSIKERVNHLYFGILLGRARIDQVALLRKDIQNGIDKTNAAISNGIALKSSGDILKAELLKSDQRIIELNADLKGNMQVLAKLINQPVDENTNFVTPIGIGLKSDINRPELKLFDSQYTSIDAQQKIVDSRKVPKVGLFLQGGYGKPALNLLNNKFDFYYIGGIKFNWPLSGLYTSKNDKQILSLQQHLIDIKKETFLLNANLSMIREENEISKLTDLIKIDEQMITLYESIVKSYSAQLENGTITTNDYLTHVNAIDVVRQDIALHKIQLVMAQYIYLTLSGN